MAIVMLLGGLSPIFTAFFAYRFLHERAKKSFLVLLAGWVLVVVIYYFVVLTPIQVLLVNTFIPGFGTYMDFVSVIWPEFLATTFVTTLIWFALPIRYRIPLWYEIPQTVTPNAETKA